MKKAMLYLAALSILMSACGAVVPTEEPTPALTGEDIQSTAVAMAWTMAAQTMEAMPTATFTPVPPTATFTPVYTETPVFTPTPIFTNTPVATATSADEIKLLYDWDGASTTFLIVNDTKATASVAIYLTEGSNARGYYGNLRGVYLEKKQSARISAPVQGYYCFWAWMSSDDRNWSLNGCFGVNNPDKHEIHLTENNIKFLTP